METRYCGYGELELVLRPYALWTIVQDADEAELWWE